MRRATNEQPLLVRPPLGQAETRCAVGQGGRVLFIVAFRGGTIPTGTVHSDAASANVTGHAAAIAAIAATRAAAGLRGCPRGPATTFAAARAAARTAAGLRHRPRGPATAVAAEAERVARRVEISWIAARIRDPPRGEPATARATEPQQQPGPPNGGGAAGLRSARRVATPSERRGREQQRGGLGRGSVEKAVFGRRDRRWSSPPPRRRA